MFKSVFSSTPSTTCFTLDDLSGSIGEHQFKQAQNAKQNSSRPARLTRPSARLVIFSDAIDTLDIQTRTCDSLKYLKSKRTRCRTTSSAYPIQSLPFKQWTTTMLSSPFLIFLSLLTLMITLTNCHSLNKFDGVNSSSRSKEFTNEFAVEINSDSCSAYDTDVCKSHLDDLADRLASKHGFVNEGQIGTLHGHYLFRHHHVSKRSIEHSPHHHGLLQNEPKVNWVEQQQINKRTKRDNYNSDFRYADQMTDPLFPEQWYIEKGASGGYDMNVEGAWALGYTGKGVVVSILDDGIQPNHPDLVRNYDPKASCDINDNDSDPTPQNNGENKHGTRCAGEVAAEANNGFCGVGVAFNASIGGVRMLDGTVTDQVEARALSFNIQHIHIYSASWGPEDDGKTVDGPGRLAKRAFLDGIVRGRNGLGSIYVWASGNGGRRSDNCNCDGYTNSIYTLSISSATQAGTKPWYLEECSSTLATTYSSGTPGKDGNIVTVDMDFTYFTNQGDQSRLCTKSHTGTSASAPIAAAMCALALEANPMLTWRDMQHLVVITSRYYPLRGEPGWATNAVGRKYSHKFGYGLMDGEALVRNAEKWVTVPPQQVCETAVYEQKIEIPLDSSSWAEASITTNGCSATQNQPTSTKMTETGPEINYLEHVQARISLKFQPRGNLKITLISPQGTQSNLLLPRPRDMEETNFNLWPFLSVHFWGENPKGRWILRITNAGDQKPLNGYLQSWGLVFYGTLQLPAYPSINQTKRRREFSRFKLNARSFANLKSSSTLQSSNDQTVSSPEIRQVNSFSPFAKTNYSKPISLTIYSVIIIVCMASLCLFFLIFVVVQLTSSRPGKLTAHDYRPLFDQEQHQLRAVNVAVNDTDDEDEISLFERKA